MRATEMTSRSRVTATRIDTGLRIVTRLAASMLLSSACATSAPEPEAPAEAKVGAGNRIEAAPMQEGMPDAETSAVRVCDLQSIREDASALRRTASSSAEANAAVEAELLADSTALLERLDDARASDERFEVELHIARSLERFGGARSVERAAALYHEVDRDAEAVGDARARSFALGFLGGIEGRGGARADAMRLTRRALFLAADADAPESLYRWYWQLGMLQRDAGEPERALHSLRRAVAIVIPLRAQSLTLRDGFEESIAPVFRAFVDLLLEHAAHDPDPRRTQAALREARNTLESFKAAELRDYFRDECLEAQPEVSPDDIPGAVVIYPVILEDRIELLVSVEGRLSSTRVDVDAETLTAHANALRRHLESRGTFRFRRYARDLYDWLIRPIEPLIPESGAATLVFVPGGVLRTIPMAALLDRETSQFLIERHPIAVTPGMRLTDPHAIPHTGAKLLAVGVSKAQPGFPALRHVPQELDELEAIFPGVELLDDEFSSQSFREQLAKRAFDMVHIASHGSFSGDTGQSFILAADGRVEMTEIADAIASTRFRERSVELLTLSACESAAGDERAALGLAGIAVRAGARSAVASLWSVHDEAASILMQNLYRALEAPDTSRGVALQRAQLTLLRDSPYRHPAYWAPFLLINNWL